MPTGHIIKLLNKENQFGIFSKGKSFSSIRGSFFLKNNFPSFIVPNNKRLKIPF